jgi:hypothetical protein
MGAWPSGPEKSVVIKISSTMPSRDARIPPRAEKSSSLKMPLAADAANAFQTTEAMIKNA